IRSRTSMTGPTSTSSPVSSSTSRATAARSVSPTSTAPPGRLHSPFSGSFARRTRSTRSSLTMTAPTPTIGRSGYIRIRLRTFGSGLSAFGFRLWALGLQKQAFSRRRSLISCVQPQRSDETHVDERRPLAFGFWLSGRALSARAPTAESLEPKALSPNPKVTSGLTFFQSHHLDDHPLPASPVELGIEHLFPWSEI